MEQIEIQNFGGIKHLILELKPITILIGPQGSGKSIAIKLLYFFKSFFENLDYVIDFFRPEESIKGYRIKEFKRFFPQNSWPENDFQITYLAQNIELKLVCKNNELDFIFNENIKQLLQEIGNLTLKNEYNNPRLKYETYKKIETIITPKARREQFFIVAGRNFFAQLENNIFPFLRTSESLDAFLVEFGLLYNRMRKSEPPTKNNETIDKILNSRHIRDNKQEFLLHDDGRKVNLPQASSGQQEILPLGSMFYRLEQISKKINISLYIEEPEAHLFPTAQNDVVKLLAETFNAYAGHSEIFITTHSPYILSSFNNLLQAGRLQEIKPQAAEQINQIIPVHQQIKPSQIAAYALIYGEKINLMDEASGLISQTILDSVSDNISTEFGQLLDLEFEA